MENSTSLILSIEPLKYRTRLYKSCKESSFLLVLFFFDSILLHLHDNFFPLYMLLCIFILMTNNAMGNFISKIEYINDNIVFTCYDEEMKCKIIDFPIHEMTSRFFNNPKGFTGVFLQIERNGNNTLRQNAIGEWSPDLIEEINEKLNSIIKTQIENQSA